MHEPQVAARLLRSMLGRRLLAVTEARHWYEGQRDSDSQSLLHFWLHFEGASAVMVHGRGEELILELAESYASYDMQEYGQTIVASAQGPDLLASVVGQRLINAAPVHAFSSPWFAGMLLRFERQDALVISFADEWLLTHGEIPTGVGEYVTIGGWLIDPE